MLIRRVGRAVAIVCAVLCGAAALQGCGEKKRLVEVFDVGPVGGPPGGSEGYMWVDVDAGPPPGKGWKPVDISTLTPEQRAKIR